MKRAILAVAFRGSPFGRFRSERLGLLVFFWAGLAAWLGCQAKDASPTPASRPEAIAKLAQQVLKVSRVSPLDLEKAAALLGSGLGARQQIHEYRSEWSLAPTEAIARGTAVHGGKGTGWKAIWFTPQDSLDLAFQDLATALLDLPFATESVWVHGHADSLAKDLDRFEYKFAVPAGELIIEVPAIHTREAPNRTDQAYDKAFDAAAGVSTDRVRVTEIHIRSETTRDWDKQRTLREFRARYKRRSK
jgi:hypothetical protein